MHTLKINSREKEEMIEITDQLRDLIKQGNVSEGVCFIYTPHTTAAVTINENADPTVIQDILKGLKNFNLETTRFAHREGNSAAHIKSSLIGCSAFIIIDRGMLQLGMWQGVFFCEFDGPRSRKVLVEIK